MSASLAFGLDHFLLLVRPVHVTRWQDPGFYPPDARTTSSPSNNNQKCLRTWPYVPWGGRGTTVLPVENHKSILT